MIAASFGYHLYVDGYGMAKGQGNTLYQNEIKETYDDVQTYYFVPNCEIVECRKVQYDLLSYTDNCYNHNSAMSDQLVSVGCEALIQTGTIVTTEIMVVY